MTLGLGWGSLKYFLEISSVERPQPLKVVFPRIQMIPWTNRYVRINKEMLEPVFFCFFKKIRFQDVVTSLLKFNLITYFQLLAITTTKQQIVYFTVGRAMKLIKTERTARIWKKPFKRQA